MDGNTRQKMMQANVAARRGGLQRKSKEKSTGWILVGMRGTNPVENKFIDIFILMESKKYVKVVAFGA